MKEQANIPVLGIDARPLKRQTIPGLCEDIINLRPDGVPEAPYWRGIPGSRELVNASGNPFTHLYQNDIVTMYFAGDSAQRLIVLLNDGTIDIIDPDSNWGVVLSHQLEGSGVWDASFAEIGALVVIAVVKDGLPYKLFYVYKDKIIPYRFPALPAISLRTLLKSYSEAEVQAGTYQGLTDGWYAWRYGFSMGGNTISLTPPLPFEVDTQGDETKYISPIFVLGGYSATNKPGNLDFWDKLLSGVDIYLSDRHDSKREVLEEGIFYNVVSFPFINRVSDIKDVQNDPNVKEFKGKTSDISVYEVAEVQAPHRIAGSAIKAYNKRLILGHVAIDFVEPQPGIYSNLVNVTGEITMTTIELSELVLSSDNLYDGSTWQRTYEFYLLAGDQSVLPESEVTVTYDADWYESEGTEMLGGGVYLTPGSDNRSVRVRVRITSIMDDDKPKPDNLASISVAATSYSDMTLQIPVDTFIKTFSDLPSPT